MNNNIKRELIGKIHLCEDLNAWGTEISATELNRILAYIEKLERDFAQVEKRANAYEQEYRLVKRVLEDYKKRNGE